MEDLEIGVEPMTPPLNKKKMPKVKDKIGSAIKEARDSVVETLATVSYLDTINKIDKYSIIKTRYDESTNTSYIGVEGVKKEISIPRELSLDETEAITKHNLIANKKSAKDEAKKKTDIRYKIGDILLLRGKIRDGSKRVIKKFEVKKVIWSVRTNPVNIIILKQIEGECNNSTLSKDDCKRYHIKYEEGLQVYSMMMNFVKIHKKLLK